MTVAIDKDRYIQCCVTCPPRLDQVNELQQLEMELRRGVAKECSEYTRAPKCLQGFPYVSFVCEARQRS